MTTWRYDNNDDNDDSDEGADDHDIDEIKIGHELAFIRQKLRLGMPHYEIYRNGSLYCTVKKKFKLLTTEFEVEMADHRNGPNLELTGDWMAYDFLFKR